MLTKIFSVHKVLAVLHYRNRFVFAFFILSLSLLFSMISSYGFASSDCKKSEEENIDVQSRCATSATGEGIEKLEEVVMDETDKTTAVPWIFPGVPSPITGPPVAPMTTDPAWDLIDTESIYQRLEESEYLAVEFDYMGNELITIQPFDPLTVKAHQAVDKSPTWLQKRLEDTFSRLSRTDQDTLADVILDANDPIVDEVAFCVANISTSDLTNAYFYIDLITHNAELLYKVDSDVDYAEIVNYGDSIGGGDYYSTVRYKVKEGEDINEYEYSRDIYYWYIVHPRDQDELPTYIDPDADPSVCTGSCDQDGKPTAPPEGRFWREYFYGCDTDNDGTIDSPCPTFFDEKCDNDHDGTKDGPCPVLRDMLREVHVLWEMKKDVVGPENGAIGQASDWVHRMLGKWGDKDGCRPITPMVVYYCQDGNCGEYQDMQTAAGRTALIPTISVHAAPACDHVWNEFYERRWIEWQAEDEQIDHPEGHDGWTGGNAGMRAYRGDGLVNTDHTSQYTPSCQLVVTVTDANGYPVDGALVKVASEPATLLCDIHSIVVEVSRGLTDENGQVTFALGDNNAEPIACRMYYVQAQTDWATYPSSGYALVIDHPQPDTTYYWSHQFTEGSVPRLSISPAADPPDPTIDNLMEVTFSVTDEYGFGDGYAWIKYREVMQPGNLDFFIADSSNYSLFTSDSAFEAFEIAIDSISGDISFIPPETDDWYAVWSNKAAHNFSQVVDANVRLYSNNGYIPPICELEVNKGSSDEAILDWENLTGVNVDAYNVYRSTNASDVGSAKVKEELAPFLIDTVSDSTYTDMDDPSPGQCFYYVIRTLGKSGDIADACTY